MARLGIARFEDLVGRVDLLEADEALQHWQTRGIDLSNVLACPDVPGRHAAPSHAWAGITLADALDWTLIDALESSGRTVGEHAIRNVNRTVGGLPLERGSQSATAPTACRPEQVRFTFRGSAGQSFGRLARPWDRADPDRRCERLRRQGPLGRRARCASSGGCRVPGRGERDRRQHRSLRRHRRARVLRGIAGERFAVRNSGASAGPSRGSVTTAASYMTGRRVVGARADRAQLRRRA